MIQDLRADSIRLSTLENSFKIGVRSKMIFEDIIEGRRTSMDSINIYFKNQYNYAANSRTNSLSKSSSVSIKIEENPNIEFKGVKNS